MSRMGMRFVCAMLCAVSVCVSACADERAQVNVDLSRRRMELPPASGAELRFAISTMFSPRETLLDYRALAAYMGAKLGRPVALVQRRGYAETNELLLGGEVDFAFICSGPFASGRSRGLTLLAVPLVGGAPTFRSLILVRADDQAREVSDLRGGSFAFVDPLSFTGRIYPEALLMPLTSAEDPFFSSTVFSHSHSDSISMVAEGRVRAAGVEDIVFNYVSRRTPEKTAGLRVLHTSKPFPAPPVVAGPRMTEADRDSLQSVLLDMRETAEGRLILQSLGFSGFTVVPAADYDEIAELRSRVLDRATPR